MKKKFIIVLIALMFLTPVIKAQELNVKTLESTITDSEVKYSGTTDDGVLAVSCSLFNSNNEEIDINSNQVENDEFEGSFSIKESDTYIVKCANYDGGQIISSEIVLNLTNPSTGDSIIKYVLIGSISIIGIIAISICTKKNQSKD